MILQLLCDRSPESSLLPRFGTLERYRVMEWLSYVGSEFHKTIGPLFNPAMPEAAKALHRQKLQRTMSTIEQCLATTPYLAGAEFTVADAYLFVMIGWPAAPSRSTSDRIRVSRAITRASRSDRRSFA